jgi:hypothetical protein
MRRKLRYVPNPRSRAFVYTCSIVALAVYAVPRLPQLHPGLAGTFSTVWILFAALAVAANLYFLFGADQERSRMLELHEADPRGKTAPKRREQDAVRRRAF